MNIPPDHVEDCSQKRFTTYLLSMKMKILKEQSGLGDNAMPVIVVEKPELMTYYETGKMNESK